MTYSFFVVFFTAIFYTADLMIIKYHNITSENLFTREELLLHSLQSLAENRTVGYQMSQYFWLDYFIHPEDDVNFLLYTRKNFDEYDELKLNEKESVTNSRFDITKPTKVVVHGWLSSSSKDYCGAMKDAFLKVQDLNVIIVDWPAFRPYSFARLAVKPVAKVLAQFLDFLVADIGIEKSTIHILGHSLGAHIAGIAGQDVDCSPLPWITGFDPAGPLFSSSPDERLDSSDADFVDVIHTSGGYLGFFDQIGHLDFYPNGGTPIQPGCGFDLGICSHSRAYEFYIVSLLDPGSTFLAAPCDNFRDFQNGRCCSGIINMGSNNNKKARGKYYLLTSGSLPYALGRGGIVDPCWS